MNLREELNNMDSMVAQGAIVDAIKNYFAETANTADYGQVTTTNKTQMVEKISGFVDSIAKVNGITLHHSLLDGNISASEFTFDFDMKDNSKIYWHEIIRREWNEEGKVISETFFNAG